MSLTYLPKFCFLTNLPYKRTDQTTWKGRFFSQKTEILADARYALPYGTVPRIFLTWLCTRIILCKERLLRCLPHVNMFSHLMRNELKILLSKGSSSRSSVSIWQNQLNNLFNATFHLSSPHQTIITKIFTEFSGNIADCNQTLSINPAFIHAVEDQAVPFKTQDLASLRNSPLLFDLYCWGSYLAFFAPSDFKLQKDQVRTLLGRNFTRSKDFRQYLKKCEANLEKLCTASRINLHKILN